MKTKSILELQGMLKKADCAPNAEMIDAFENQFCARWNDPAAQDDRRVWALAWDAAKFALVADAVADEREACAKLIEGTPEILDGRPAHRGPGDVGSWYDTSPGGFRIRSMARCIRARGQS